MFGVRCSMFAGRRRLKQTSRANSRRELPALRPALTRPCSRRCAVAGVCVCGCCADWCRHHHHQLHTLGWLHSTGARQKHCMRIIKCPWMLQPTKSMAASSPKPNTVWALFLSFSLSRSLLRSRASLNAFVCAGQKRGLRWARCDDSSPGCRTEAQRW